MQRQPGLDLLRALAVLVVMLFHSWVIGGVSEPWQHLANYGWMGVDLFFVLSGYLIGYPLLCRLRDGRGLDLVGFWQRRAWRILPAYLVVLAVYLAFPGWRELPGVAPWWEFLSFTLNLLIDYPTQPAFSHAWSLCVEEQFYLLFPLLAWWLTRRPSLRKTLVVSGVIVFGGMAWRAYVCWRGLDNLMQVYYATYARLDGLLAGVLLAAVRAYRGDRWQAWQQHASRFAWLGTLLLAGAVSICTDRSNWPASVFGYPLIAAAMACWVIAGAGDHSFGRWRVPTAGWFARCSYSLYLSHKLALHAAAQWLARHPGVHGLAAFGCYALAILGLGALLHYAVERPCLRLRGNPRTVLAEPAL